MAIVGISGSPIQGGNRCEIGGLWDMVGHDKEKLRNFEITPDKFKRWEDCPRTVAEVERYAQVLAELPDA